MACNSATLNSAFGKHGPPLWVQGLFGHVYPGVTGSIVASYAEQWLKHLAGNAQAHTQPHTHEHVCLHGLLHAGDFWLISLLCDPISDFWGAAVFTCVK